MGDASKHRSNIQEDILQILTEFDSFLDNVFESPLSSPDSDTNDRTKVFSQIVSCSNRQSNIPNAERTNVLRNSADLEVTRQSIDALSSNRTNQLIDCSNASRTNLVTNCTADTDWREKEDEAAASRNIPYVQTLVKKTEKEASLLKETLGESRGHCISSAVSVKYIDKTEADKIYDNPIPHNATLVSPQKKCFNSCYVSQPNLVAGKVAPSLLHNCVPKPCVKPPTHLQYSMPSRMTVEFDSNRDKSQRPQSSEKSNPPSSSIPKTATVRSVSSLQSTKNSTTTVSYPEFIHSGSEVRPYSKGLKKKGAESPVLRSQIKNYDNVIGEFQRSNLKCAVENVKNTKVMEHKKPGSDVTYVMKNRCNSAKNVDLQNNVKMFCEDALAEGCNLRRPLQATSSATTLRTEILHNVQNKYGKNSTELSNTNSKVSYSECSEVHPSAQSVNLIYTGKHVLNPKPKKEAIQKNQFIQKMNTSLAEELPHAPKLFTVNCSSAKSNEPHIGSVEHIQKTDPYHVSAHQFVDRIEPYASIHKPEPHISPHKLDLRPEPNFSTIKLPHISVCELARSTEPFVTSFRPAHVISNISAFKPVFKTESCTLKNKPLCRVEPIHKAEARQKDDRTNSGDVVLRVTGLEPVSNTKQAEKNRCDKGDEKSRLRNNKSTPLVKVGSSTRTQIETTQRIDSLQDDERIHSTESYLQGELINKADPMKRDQEEDRLLSYVHDLLSTHSARIAAGIMSVEHRGTKALELWTRRVTLDYDGVSVNNMTTAWRDGLAFCALIHHFRPDLIDFKALKPGNILENNALAFRTAEQHLGIPALLDAEDMVDNLIPDRLSILTYVSQFYQAFSAQGLIGPGGRKSPTSENNAKNNSDSVENNPPTKQSPPLPKSSVSPLFTMSSRAKPISQLPDTLQTKTDTEFKTDKVTVGNRGRRELCNICQNPVFLAERLLVGVPGQLRHRTCFRCDRCTAQLTLASYYETEKGQFCCETCPDEERVTSSEAATELTSVTGEKEGSSSSSDSESDSEDYSELSSGGEEPSSISKGKPVLSKFSKARTAFLSKTLDNETTLKPLPTELPPPKPVRSSPQLYVDEEQMNSLALPSLSTVVHHHSPEGERHSGLSCCDDTKGEATTPPVTTTVLSTGQKDFYKLGNESRIVLSRRKLFEKDKNDSSRQETTKNNTKDINRYSSPAGVANSSLAAHVITDKHKTIHFSNSVVANTAGLEVLSSTVKKEITNLNQNKDDANSFSGSCSNSEVDSRKDNETITEAAQSVCPPTISDEMLNKVDGVTAGTTYTNTSVLTAVIEDDTRQSSDNTVAVDDAEHIMPISTVSPSGPQNSNETSIYSIKTVEIKKTDASEVPNEIIPSNESLKLDVSFERQSVLSNEYDRVNYENKVDENEMPPKTLVDTTVKTENAATSVQDLTCPDSPEYPNELNPFDSLTGSEAAADEPKTVQNIEENQISISAPEKQEQRPCTDPLKTVVKSPVNPFDSEEDDRSFAEDEFQKPKKYLNPFWSDEESDSSATLTKSRVKPPRPPPPTLRRDLAATPRMLLLSGIAGGRITPPSPTLSSRSSSSDQSTLRLKKKLRQAPAPPPATSISPYRQTTDSVHIKSHILAGEACCEDDAISKKMQKDFANHTSKLLMGVTGCRDEQSTSDTKKGTITAPKSECGEWRRKKGPAPLRPVPQKRVIRKLPMRQIQQELQDIEVKQTELERQGVLLETTIRERTESPADEAGKESLSCSEGQKSYSSLASNSSSGSLGADVEEMILQLFELVNEKNELFRRQTELMYLKREKRLEEEYVELEYQIRCLMLKPPSEKSEADIQHEEELLARLVKVVDQRDEIVNCLELERKREALEDESIASHLIKYQEKHIEGIESDDMKEPSKKKKKKKIRLLKKKKKGKEKEKLEKMDADKDVDESEIKKEKKKKKNWFKKPLLERT